MRTIPRELLTWGAVVAISLRLAWLMAKGLPSP